MGEKRESKIRYYRKNYGRIAENFFSLSVLNAISFLFPLITIPYLTRVLGPEKFGVVSFALVIAQYFILFTSFGFAYSATQQISIHQNDRRRVSSIFSAVISVKLLISVLCALVLFVLILTTKQFRENGFVFVFAFGMVIGDALVPVWLFQGMEKMKFITIVNFVSKLLFTLLIFIFVKSEADFYIVPLFNALGTLVAGILSFLIAYRLFRLYFMLPSWREVTIQIRESWPIFVSTFSVNLYRNANILLLGLFTNYTITGFYSSAEKVIKGIQSVITPVSDALFPYMSKRFSTDTMQKNLHLVNRLSKYYFVVLALISVLFLVFARPIVTLFLGDKFIDSILDMQVMSFVVLFGGMNYFLGIVGLINMGFKKKFMVFVAITGVVSVINLAWMIYFWADTGASASMLVSEVLLFVLLVVFFSKLKKQYGTNG